MNDYNKTQLDLNKALGRLIIHRDYNAHLFRFGHILKQLKINNPKIILDVGCGNRQLAMCIYTNKKSSCVKEYHGVDLRTTILDELKDFNKFPLINYEQDVTSQLPKVYPDIVTCFEVLEHMSKDKGIDLLNQIKEAMTNNTILYFSTPCFNESKGAAANHIYEWKYQELKEELEKYFIIENCWGTFCDTGIGENKKFFEEHYGIEIWNKMKEYFESSILSNLVAPLFPEKSRNCLWKLKLK